MSNNIKVVNESCDDFWGITTFYNPKNYKNKIDNYKAFRKHSQAQGLNLLVVECALKNKPFQLKPQDADKLVQVRSDSVLWHKENLLNIGLKNLPDSCNKIVWLDADIIFLNNNWVEETRKNLNYYDVVKPFKEAIRLPENDSKKVIKNGLTDKLKFKKKYKVYKNENENYDNFINYFSVFSLAAKRSIFSDAGFYDKMILGGGDSVITTALMGLDPVVKNLHPKLKEDLLSWGLKINKEKQKKFIIIDGKIIHLFHSIFKNRKYVVRQKILEKYDFDPNKDVCLNNFGCLDWSSDKQGLHREVSDYFSRRNENNSFFYHTYLFFRYKEERLIYSDPIIKKITNLYYFFKKYLIRIKNIKYKKRLSRPYLIIKKNKKESFYIDAALGKIGILIKKINPRLYYFLKKYMNNKN